MLELIETQGDNIVGLKISGKIQPEELEQVASVIEEKLKTHDKVRIFVEVLSIKGVALEALLNDLRLSVKHFRDIDKEAICSDKGWLKTLAGVGDKLFPSIEVKHFSLEEREQALQWLQS